MGVFSLVVFFTFAVGLCVGGFCERDCTCIECIVDKQCVFVEFQAQRTFECVRKQDYNPLITMAIYKRERDCIQLAKYLSTKRILPIPMNDGDLPHSPAPAATKGRNAILPTTTTTMPTTTTSTTTSTTTTTTPTTTTTIRPTVKSTTVTPTTTAPTTTTTTTLPTTTPTTPSTTSTPPTSTTTLPTNTTTATISIPTTVTPIPKNLLSLPTAATTSNIMMDNGNGPFPVTGVDANVSFPLMLLPQLDLEEETMAFSCEGYKRDAWQQKVRLAACRILALALSNPDALLDFVEFNHWIMRNPMLKNTQDCIRIRYQRKYC